MHARSICCYKTDVPGITLRRYDPHMPPPRNTCALLAPPLSSCTTRELISDFASIFFLLSFYFCYLRVVKCEEKMIEDDREGVFFCAGMGRVDKLISSNKVYIDRFFRGC